MRVSWTARRSNQSILKISPEISLEGMMLKLKLQDFGHLVRRVESLEKTLMLGGIGGRRRRGRQRMRWLDGITVSMDMSIYIWRILWTEDSGGLPFMGSQRVGPEKAMANHSSTLAGKVPWMEEPGRLLSTGSLGVRHD